MTSYMESNWVTELGTLQCLGEGITIVYMIYYCEEVLKLDCLDSIDKESILGVGEVAQYIISMHVK